MISAGAKKGKGGKVPKSASPVKASIVKKKPSKNDVEDWGQKVPPLGSPLPLMFNGCKIYESPGAFRVMPSPKSKYDRRFPFKVATQSDVWKEMIDYCKKPFIPKGSANYVPL